MTCTELSAQKPSAKTGLLGTLPAFLRLPWSGAPSAPRLRRSAISLAALCAFLFALAITAVPVSASAATTFCPPGSAAGQCEGPSGVAVDQSSGNVYVGEGNRVSEFDSAGNFIRAFGFGVATGAEELQTCTTVCQPGDRYRGLGPGLAVDNSGGESEGDVYADNYRTGGIEKFQLNPIAEEYELLLSFGGCSPFLICPLAVDPSGHLWVGNEDRLEEFSPEGEFLSELKLPGAGKISSLAVDAAGNFYVITPAVNERQTITPPESGTYTLSFEGKETEPIPYNTTVGVVEKELEALTTIGAGNARLGGNPNEVFSTSREVEFRRALGGTNVPQLVASAGSVTTGRDGVPGVLSKLNPSGELLYTLDASGHPAALALDPASGDLFVSDQLDPQLGENYGGATLLEFDSTGEELEAFGRGEVIGAPQGNALAFGAGAQRLYLVSSAGEGLSAAQIFTVPPPGPLPGAGTAKATEITKTAATLQAEVNPEGAETTYHFDYITEEQFKADGNDFGAGTEETPESASIGSDFEPHPASQAITGLAPATTYRFRLVASNENGIIDGETASFETLPPAAIDTTSASDVSAESATLNAEINPLGDATSYRFQYLTEVEFEENLEEGPDGFSGANLPTAVPVPDAPLGAGSKDVSVSQHIQGLSPHTAYRYRVLALNAIAPAGFPGPALAFTTQAPGSLALPDARQWELVSPPDKRGARLGPIGSLSTIQAATGGEAIAYGTSSPTEAGPQGYATLVLSTRGPLGWSSRDLGAPHSSATGTLAGQGSEFPLFSTDLSLGLLQPTGAFEPSLSPEASEQTPYLRTDFPAGEVANPCLSACYRPLISGAPGFANVPEGTKFGEEGQCPPAVFCGAAFRGASPDLAHVVLTSPRVALTSTPLKKGASALYQYSANKPPSEQLQLISALPDGKPVDGDLGYLGQDARNAISADGSRVVFESERHLYLRYNATEPPSEVSGVKCTEAAKACTVQLDALQGGTGLNAPHSVFQLASADGSKLFFLDQERLTADSGGLETVQVEGDLYQCEMVEEEGGELGCALSDLTPLGPAGESAHVKAVLGASEDGSYLYFAADAALAPGAKPGKCSTPAPANTCNLYLRHNGTTSLIATLSSEDFGDWAHSESQNLHALTARVSPSGRWLAFMSQRPLSGYENRDAVSGKPDQEVFLYDAAAAGGEGSLVCASCNPTGARPHGVEVDKLGASAYATPLSSPDAWEKTTWLAANVPGWTPYQLSHSLYQSRYLSDSGRLFFNSSDALLPQDTNGGEDVYQYEPPGVGGCTAESPTYSSPSAGCVDLISSGASAEESGFLDASESGDDVFFLTLSKLTPQDVDTSIDVYDAHACSAAAPCFPSPPPPTPVCEGDACQPPAVPPSDPTPASLTFHGAGNVKEGAPKPRCTKGKVRSRGRCVAKHHKKKKKGSHKRANTNRGATR